MRSIREFNEIITRDKGEKGDTQARKKLRAVRELTYIYFVADPFSPYNSYPLDKREIKIKEDLEIPQDWKPDTLVLQGVNKYKELTEPLSFRLLQSAKDALNKMDEYFQSVDFTETNEKGTLLYEPIDLLKVIAALPTAIEGLNKIEEKIRTDIKSLNTRVRSGGEIAALETPDR